MDTRQAREQLEARLAAITRRVGKVAHDLRGSHDRDLDESAIERENDEVLEQLDEDGRREIEQIRAALERIDRGSYDVCSACGGRIDAERLAALPYAATCIDCAAV